MRKLEGRKSELMHNGTFTLNLDVPKVEIPITNHKFLRVPHLPVSDMVPGNNNLYRGSNERPRNPA